MQINLDGKLLGAMTRIFDVIVATLLFALCCLPVVTIGASLSAVYATMLSIADDSCSGIFRRFFGAFRDNFKQATPLWLLNAVVGLVVIADIVVCWGFEMEATMLLSIMRGLTFFCTGLYAAMSVYVFSGIAVFHVTWKQAISNALFWTIKKLPATLCLLLCYAAMAVSIGILWFFAFPMVALCLYLQARLLRRVFELETPKIHHEEEIDYT